MAQADLFSPTLLMRLLGTAQAPVIIDVSLDEDVESDPFLVPTARRCKHDRIEALVPDLLGQDTVVICQKGRKLSQGAAALLRARGVAARALDGGNLGWRAAGLPRLPLAYLPAPHSPSRWVAAAAPRLNDLACGWCIRRFIAPKADILFVDAEEVEAVAERFSAMSFGHFEGSQTAHPFRAALSHYGLNIPALEAMADLLETRAGAAGGGAFAALAAGLRLSHPDGLSTLNATMPVFDALYLWARDGRTEQVAA